MKVKWKAAAGIPIILFCILLGCEKKEDDEGILVLGSASKTDSALQETEADVVIQKSAESEETLISEATLEEEQSVAVPFEDAPVKVEVCVVHICGAVSQPGVYTLDAGSRIYQVVEAAGGFREDAREDYLNQADPVVDGMKIYVPTREETKELAWVEISESNGVISDRSASGQNGSMENAESSSLININTAGEELLCTLPGVGSSKAKSIIAYREANGAYQSIEDIMNVEGIKEGLFQKIRDSITV